MCFERKSFLSSTKGHPATTRTERSLSSALTAIRILHIVYVHINCVSSARKKIVFFVLQQQTDYVSSQQNGRVSRMLEYTHMHK